VPAIKRMVERWVEMWNTYDLSQIDALFLHDERLTYFSSEREGAFRGIDAVREHHRSFGFVEGGKASESKLWVEDLDTANFGSMAIVTGIWCFQRPFGKVQRGPVTLVYVVQNDEARLAHLNFGNYPSTTS